MDFFENVLTTARPARQRPADGVPLRMVVSREEFVADQMLRWQQRQRQCDTVEASSRLDVFARKLWCPPMAPFARLHAIDNHGGLCSWVAGCPTVHARRAHGDRIAGIVAEELDLGELHAAG